MTSHSDSGSYPRAPPNPKPGKAGGRNHSFSSSVKLLKRHWFFDSYEFRPENWSNKSVIAFIKKIALPFL